MKKLLNDEEFVAHIRKTFKGYTHAQIGKLLGLTPGFISQILEGHRKPSKAILNAMGFEKVVRYKKK